MCKVNGGKISHKKLEESGACTVSVAFCCAQLRNRAAVPELRTVLRPGVGFALRDCPVQAQLQVSVLVRWPLTPSSPHLTPQALFTCLLNQE